MVLSLLFSLPMNLANRPRISLWKSILLLFIATGCYEPADLTPEEDVEIPCVRYIIRTAYGGDVSFPTYPVQNEDGSWNHKPGDDSSVCYLELSYVTPSGKPTRFEDKAVITIERWDMDEYGRRRFAEKDTLISVGDGNYYDRLTKTDIEGSEFRLSVFLPGGDTLTAATTMPDFQVADSPVIYYPLPAEESRPTEFDLNGKHYVYPGRGDNCWKARYLIVPSDYAVWAYKVSYSGYGKDNWFVEDELTTDLTDRVDPFNRTGKTYQGHTLLPGEEAYPELFGRQLHYRYLRFPPAPTADSLMISGNFSGLHYGRIGSDLVYPKSDQYQEKYWGIVFGRPYEDSILSSGRAGYVLFKVVSHEYDRYLKEVAEYELLHEVSTDIVGIYQNTNTYTNIKGGVGIFGAEINFRYYWTNGTWNF